jgi:hypothetical protein
MNPRDLARLIDAADAVALRTALSAVVAEADLHHPAPDRDFGDGAATIARSEGRADFAEDLLSLIARSLAPTCPASR